MDHIRIRGARTHNLKNIHLDIPRDRLVVITGLSGSGRVLPRLRHPLHAEGQRRYVESLSAYARQFSAAHGKKPDVDLIEGLSPAISIEQKATSHNPRSTVGTVDRKSTTTCACSSRAWANPHCPEHGLALSAQSVSQWSTTCSPSRGHARHGAGAAGDQGRKGEQAGSLRGTALAGVREAAHQRRGPRDRPVAEARAQPQAHIEIVVDRLKCSPTPSSGSPNPSRRPFATPTARARGGDGQRPGHLFSAKFACPLAASPIRSSSRASFPSTTPSAHAPLRRAGQVTYFDPKARGRIPAPVARGRRDPRLGPAQPVLLLHARGPSRSTTVSTWRRPSRPCRSARRPSSSAGRARRRSPSATRASAASPRCACMPSRNPPQPRAPLPRDRLGGGEGGTRQVPEQPRVPRLRRNEASPRGAPRPGRRAVDRGDLGDAAEGGAALLREPRARRQPPGDRRKDPSRDRQPHQVPQRRGTRLPVAHALGRHAVGWRGAAHPPREPDRLRAHRRDVRARRAVDRPAPAGQREADRPR